jgi:hypothetical protein
MRQMMSIKDMIVAGVQLLTIPRKKESSRTRTLK